MRQRKAKNLDRRLRECGAYLITPHAEAETEPERETKLMEVAFPDFSMRRNYLEIGCGRGDFLLQKALADPEGSFLGIEGQETVVLRALEKAVLAGGPEGTGILKNLRFACVFVQSMETVCPPKSLDGIYLNFSDPWPKARHAKRRLTYRGRLLDYADALRPGGFIEIKTDNTGLFDFTLEEIEACGWTPAMISRDLHESGYAAAQTMTEYEKKFRAAGVPVCYVRVEP